MLTKSCSNTFILNLIFNLLLFEQTSPKPRSYIYVPLEMTWSLAQKYCRENHTDLATFRDQSDTDALQDPCNFTQRCWIGLHRDKQNSNGWDWSDGDESSFKKWSINFNQPDNSGGHEDCVAMGSSRWHDMTCDSQLAFVCYDNLILVKENKTWEKALEHCRNLDTDTNLIDLPHMDSGNDTLHARRTVLDAQTPEVWIGLRFLAGRWLWVNGMPLQKQLPACPAPGMNCGTMSKTGELWPRRNCLQRRNFFCLIKN